MPGARSSASRARPSASVSAVGDRAASREELDAHAGRGPPGGRVEHVGRERAVTRRNLLAWTRWARAISASSARTSAPPRTTSSPPTTSRSTRCGPERTRPATRSSAPPSSRPSVRQTARSACLPGSSDPMSSRRSTSAPPRVASRSASRAVIASPPPRPRATSSACFTSMNRSPRSFDAEPSTPSPTRTPASTSSRTGATPAPRRRFEVGQCATRSRRPEPRRPPSSERWTQCAHQTSSSSQPSRSRYSTGRQP